jgi:hypothetical protein
MASADTKSKQKSTALSLEDQFAFYASRPHLSFALPSFLLVDSSGGGELAKASQRSMANTQVEPQRFAPFLPPLPCR